MVKSTNFTDSTWTHTKENSFTKGSEEVAHVNITAKTTGQEKIEIRTDQRLIAKLKITVWAHAEEEEEEKIAQAAHNESETSKNAESGSSAGNGSSEKQNNNKNNNNEKGKKEEKQDTAHFDSPSSPSYSPQTDGALSETAPTHNPERGVLQAGRGPRHQVPQTQREQIYLNALTRNLSAWQQLLEKKQPTEKFARRRLDSEIQVFRNLHTRLDIWKEVREQQEKPEPLIKFVANKVRGPPQFEKKVMMCEASRDTERAIEAITNYFWHLTNGDALNGNLRARLTKLTG